MTPATVAKVVGYGSRAGTFGTVTGSGFTITYDAGGVSVHAPGPWARRVAIAALVVRR